MDTDVRERIAAIEKRLKDGSTRMDGMQKELTENTKATLENTKVALEIKDILDMARAGLKVLGGLGSVAKWLGILAAAGSSIWVFVTSIKHGTPPK